jgi:histidyl-tRNA synthetase
MNEKLTAVKGMNDILPPGVPRTDKLPDSRLWLWFEEVARQVLHRHGYQHFITPVVEGTPLFVRGIGAATDIVEKEMYSFEDKLNGDALTLRPEITAGIVRALIEHNALYNGPLRLWGIGPVFRHERPQKGRYRQFHQLDVEAMGFGGPEVDAEIILLARQLLTGLGLKVGEQVQLEINSLGQPAERRAHRDALVAHFQAHETALDEDGRRRLHTNPLRLLDSKAPAMQTVIESAPVLLDFLGDDSRAHFETVQAALTAAGLPFIVKPRLVRGLDYYNHTVFEWVTGHLGSQGTVCGGGRYDGLFEQFGGKPTPAVGFGLGIERLLLLLQTLEVSVPSAAPDAYAVVAQTQALPRVLGVLDALRSQGVSVLMHPSGSDGMGSMKSQFKKADASGAQFALVFGADELAAGQVLVKPLRGGKDAASSAQVARPLNDVAAWAATLQSSV